MRQSKTVVLGLCLCVAAIPAALPASATDSSDLTSASQRVMRPLSLPASHVIVVSSYLAVVPRVASVMRVQSTVTAAPNELIDNNSGVFNGNFAADARSTHTLDWSCIRNAESHDNYRQVSGAYGILTSTWLQYGETGVPGAASVAVQDAFALRLFAANGYRFSGSWNDMCTQTGLG